MRNVLSIFFLSLFILAISSCQKEEPEAYVCGICGKYNGTFSGSLSINLTGLDTTFSDLPTSLEISHQDSNLFNIDIDLSSIHGVDSMQLVVDYEGILTMDSLTTTNFDVSRHYLIPIIFNGSIGFPFTNAAQGHIDISADAIGNIDFEVYK